MPQNAAFHQGLDIHNGLPQDDFTKPDGRNHWRIKNERGTTPGTDPGFLERGFVCVKVWGFALLISSHFSQIFHENELIWDQIISFP